MMSWLRTFIFLLFIAASTVARSSEQGGNSDLTTDLNPSTLIEGCVDVASRDIVLRDELMSLGGPDPLVISRVNAGNCIFESDFGWSFGIDFPLSIQPLGNSKHGRCYGEWAPRGGAREGLAGKKDNDKRIRLRSAPNAYLFGRNNLSFGYPSGQTHPENTVFVFEPEAKYQREVRVEAGDGTRRLYRKENGEKTFKLRSERLPSGNQRSFNYDQKGRLTSIQTQGRDGTCINEARFSYQPNFVFIDGSDGQQTIIQLKKTKIRGWMGDIYHQPVVVRTKLVRGSCMPETDYTPFRATNFVASKKHGIVRRPEGWEVKFNFRERDGCADRIRVSHGPGGTLRDKWTLSGGVNGSCVTTPFGGTVNYTFDQQYRLKKVQNEATSEHWEWQQTSKEQCPLLRRHWVQDSSGDVLKDVTLTYDAYGNVLEEKVVACLCEEGSLDAFRRSSTYSDDGFNLRLSESDTNGVVTHYRYVPETNLLAAKWLEVDGDIVQREVFHYDDCANIVYQMEDDGHSEDPEDLEGVTWRRIRRVTPRLQAAGFGQPEVETLLYWDRDSDREQLLQRIEYSYDERGLCTQKDTFDADGRFACSETFAYGEHRKLTRHCDAAGRTIEYAYNDAHLLVTEWHRDSGETIHHTYDARYREIGTRVEYADGSVTESSQEWHLGDLPVSVTDRYGKTTSTTYDTLGRAVQVSDVDGTQLYEYDALGRVSAHVDSEGYRTETLYNLRGQPLRVTHPDGSTTQNSYDLQGRLTKTIEPDGSSVNYRYDALGHCVEETRARGSFSESIERRFVGGLLVEEQEPGIRRRFSYDGAGRPIACWENDRLTTTQYDELGRVHETRRWLDDLNFVSTVQRYDVLGQVTETEIRHSDGSLLSYEERLYDLRGNVTEIRSAVDSERDAVSTFHYNAAGELIEERDPSGARIKHVYDHHHRNSHGDSVLRTLSTDARGRITECIHDPSGRVVRQSQFSPDGRTLSRQHYTYDRRGLTLRETHDVYSADGFERSYTIRYEYDALGQCIALHQPEQSSYTEYDLARRITAITQPNGVRIQHHYDDAGDLVGLSSSDGSLEHRFAYDAQHFCIQGTDVLSGTTVERRYDAFGNLLSEVRGDLEQHYTYDHLDRRSHFELPRQLGAVDYQRRSGRLFAVQRSGPRNYEHRYDAYDLQGRPARARLVGNAGELITERDTLGRPTKITSPQWTQECADAAYDEMGLLTGYRVSHPAGSLSSDFSYDEWDQLARESGYFAREFSYDSLENRLGANEVRYQLDESHQLLSAGECHFTYDLNGNPIRRSGRADSHYSYDALNRLVAVETPMQRITYEYDVFHRRLARHVFERSAEGWQHSDTETYLWDGDCEIGALDATGRLRQLRVLGLGFGLEVGAAIAVEIGEQVFAPVHDSCGNLCCLINHETGESDAEYSYSAFGECRASERLPYSNPWRFSSKREAPELEGYYFGHRFYLPEFGRWLTPDPLGLADGINVYCYAHNRPVALIDPTGLLSDWLLIAQGAELDISGQSACQFFPDQAHATNPYHFEQATRYKQSVENEWQTAASLTCADFLFGNTRAAWTQGGGLGDFASGMAWDAAMLMGPAKVAKFAGKALRPVGQGVRWLQQEGRLANVFQHSGVNLLPKVQQQVSRASQACPTASGALKPAGFYFDAAMESACEQSLIRLEKAMGPGAHFYSRHGAQTTMQQQFVRATTGLTPDGFQRRLTTATRFLSHRDALQAVRMAIKLGQPGVHEVSFAMDRLVGAGYASGGKTFRFTSHVKAFFRNGKLVTVFPEISKL